jgi:hypothetical protein
MRKWSDCADAPYLEGPGQWVAMRSVGRRLRIVPEISVTYPADLESVAAARRLLRQMLQQWSAPGYDVAGPTVLSELATNAVLHGQTGFTVHLRLDGDRLWIEVSDSSPAMPHARHYSPTATTGRGLGIVAAMGEAWGADQTATGKRVWCRLRPDGGARGASDGSGSEELEEVDALPTPRTPSTATDGAPPVGGVTALAAA